MDDGREDANTGCGLILDAVLTFLNLRPELGVSLIWVSASSIDRTLFIDFTRTGHTVVGLEVKRFSAKPSQVSLKLTPRSK
jgi:hypothetical protein